MAHRLLHKTDKQGIAIPLWVIAMFLFISASSCSREKREMVDVIFDKENTYTMRSTGVSTLISDSGITRYKLVAEEWLCFEEATEPYWFFPEKVHVEKFDTLFQVEASIDADTAYFFRKQKLWKLIGHVEVENFEGERFETSLLFWDQNQERIYSDQYIRITKGDFINTGVGFESNQMLTQWRIFNAGAEIPFQEKTSDTTNIEKTPSI
jgi:LPS export ABC transporter protein LptC